MDDKRVVMNRVTAKDINSCCIFQLTTSSMPKPFKISGTGCALVDYLYKPVDFSSHTFGHYLSQQPGDGGLSPGKLVFTEELEQFAGKRYPTIREEITEEMDPVAVNIGGPSIVSLIHVAQMLRGSRPDTVVRFYGCRGNDHAGRFIEKKLSSTPLQTGSYKVVDKYTPFTDVLVDPAYDAGYGERIFINNIGAAWELYPDDLDDEFFDSQMVVFGATALVPNIHRSLKELLMKAKGKGAITIVNTVFDFLNEKKDPDKPWPMGGSSDSYPYIDLLITDHEEALRHSGCKSTEEALAFFREQGTRATIVTHGPNPVQYFSQGGLFSHCDISRLPVSERAISEIRQNPALAGDTTGCGDNFAGGVIASVASQLIENNQMPIDMVKAIALGVASGGFACFFHGGTYFEQHPGEKAQLVMGYFDEYMKQIGGNGQG